MRRFTRLTNAFSKKIGNHLHMLSLYFVHYNFCRIHKSLRMSPAMSAGISRHIAGYGVDSWPDRRKHPEARTARTLQEETKFKLRHYRKYVLNTVVLETKEEKIQRLGRQDNGVAGESCVRRGKSQDRTIHRFTELPSEGV